MTAFRREAGLWLAIILLLRVLCWAGLNGGEDCSYVLLAGEPFSGGSLASPQGGRVAWMGWLALCQSVVGVRGTTSGWVSLPPLLLLSVLAIRWGWELGGIRAARACALVVAVHPRLSYYATLAYAETLCAALLALCLSVLLLPGRAQRPWGAWIAGVIGGMAFLSHEIALVPLALAPLLLQGKWRRILPYAAGLATVYAADVGLKAAFTGDLLHRFHQAVEVTGAAHRNWTPSTGACLRRVTVEWWRPLLAPWDRLFVFDAGATGLALLGWGVALRRRQPLLVPLGGWWLMALFSLDVFPSSLSPYLPALAANNPRHLLPLVFPLLLLAGNGFSWLLLHGWGRTLAALFLVVSLGASFVLGVDARNRISVCARASVRLAEVGRRDGRNPEATFWTDPYSALMLRAILAPEMASRVEVIRKGMKAESLHGYVLWDPVWWARLKARGEGVAVSEDERKHWCRLATFTQRKRPSQWGRPSSPDAGLYVP